MTWFFLAIVALLAVVGYTTGAPITSTTQASPDNEKDMAKITGQVELQVNPTVPGGNSDGSLTGSSITNDSSTWPGASNQYPNGSVWDICTAVALAEGYNGGPGVAPYDLNNPGDLSPGDEAGQATAGKPEVHDGSSIIHFALAEGGFIALYTKFFNIVSGNSKVYPKTFTWAQVAQKYAGNSAAWLTNVTNYLGVDPASTPATYVGLA
jgi:hypothetical protein